MRVVVTGVAGFIAPHVMRALQEAGHSVVGWDIRAPALAEVPVIVADLLDQDRLVASLTGVDVICHLAGVGDVYLAAAEPLRTVRDNVMATVALTQAARRAGVRRLVFASTWEVYGTPVYQPMDELHPTQPQHPYSITKLAAELLGASVSEQQGGPEFVTLRLGTAYGPGMRASTVFHRFADQAQRGEPLTIQGNGRQYRQFTHVADLARAFCLALAPAVPAGTYNIAAAEAVSIARLAQATLRHFGGRVQHTAWRDGEPPVGRVSVERARDVLGWEARVPFAQGIEALFDSFPRKLPTVAPHESRRG